MFAQWEEYITKTKPKTNPNPKRKTRGLGLGLGLVLRFVSAAPPGKKIIGTFSESRSTLLLSTYLAQYHC